MKGMPTADDVARAVADRVAALLAEKPGAALVLPAGATPRPLYAELVRRALAGALDLAHAHVFQLDEYVGPGADDPRSFHAFLRRELLGRVSRAPGRDHLLDGAASDPRAAIASHAADLAALGGADLVLLGLGRNGHVGFNEPGAGPDQPAALVELAEATRAGAAAAWAPAPPPERGITLGLADLRAAREVLVLVTGAGKREVLAAWRAGAELPAAHLGRSVAVLADDAALGQRTSPA